MSEPLIRRITHEVVRVDGLKFPQLQATLRFGSEEDDFIVIRSPVYPEYVDAAGPDDSWWHLCATGMRHQNALFNKLFFGVAR